MNSSQERQFRRRWGGRIVWIAGRGAAGLLYSYPVAAASGTGEFSVLQGRTIAILCYNNSIQPDLTVKPGVTRSREGTFEVSGYSFQLQEGVPFHHGKGLQAEDVLFFYLSDSSENGPHYSNQTLDERIVSLKRQDLEGQTETYLERLLIPCCAS